MYTVNSQRVPFTEAVSDCTGGNLKIKRRDYKLEGQLPVIDQGQDFVAGYIDEVGAAYRGKLPIILFGDHTRCFKIVNFPFALGADGVKALEPKEGFDAKFLYFYFRSVRLPNAGYSRHFKFLREISVPKPSLDEQHYIVDILSRAEGIVRLRREAQKKTEEIIPALFFEMFGDPAANPKKWPILSLEELCTRITDGTHQPPKFQDTGIPFLFISNIVSGEIDFNTKKCISSETYSELTKRCPVDFGDVLYSTVGSYGVPVKVDTHQPFAFQRHIAHIKPIRELLDPDFLVGMLTTPALRLQADSAARGIAQKTVNLSEIRKFRVIVPPLDEQCRFAKLVASVRSSQTQQRAALEKAQAIFDALLTLSFNNIDH